MKTGFQERLLRALTEYAPPDIRGDKKAFQLAMRDALGGGEDTRTGTSYPAVLGYFSGATTPSLAWVEAAADLLGVRAGWLAFGRNAGEPTDEEQAQSDFETWLSMESGNDPLWPVVERYCPEAKYFDPALITQLRRVMHDHAWRAQSATEGFEVEKVGATYEKVFPALVRALYTPLVELDSPLVHVSPFDRQMTLYIEAVLHAIGIAARTMENPDTETSPPDGTPTWREYRERIIRGQTGPENEDARHPGEE